MATAFISPAPTLLSRSLRRENKLVPIPEGSRRSGIMKPWPLVRPRQHSHAGAWERVKKPLPLPLRERGSREGIERALIKACLLALGITAVNVVPAAATDFAKGDYVTPDSRAAGLENCVRETGFMRRNHMELIEHRRDLTVHQGIRSTTDSLAVCIDCHVGYDQQRQPVPVYADGQFCRNCHEFAAVDMNCFDCHAGVPVHPAGGPIRPGGGRKAGLSTGSPERPDGTRDVKQGVGE